MKNKRNQGITMIALIITIIVLLILAGITIETLTRDNGIINNSKQAKEQTEIENEKELIDLVVINASKNNKNGEIDKSDLEKELNNKLGNDKYKLEGEGPFKITYEDSDRSYIIQKDGKIEEYHSLDSLKLGDYVNYTYDESDNYVVLGNADYVTSNTGGYSQSIPQTKQLKWRIFNIDEITGTIDLISDTTTENILILRSTPGYINGVNIVNNICREHYSNKELGIIARSIKIEDIYDKMNAVGKEAVKSNQEKVITSTKYLLYPSLYAYETGSGVDTEEALKGGISASEMVDVDKKVKEWWGKAESKLTITQTYFTAEDTSIYYDDNDIYSMIFETNRYYWVASRYAKIYSEDNATMFGIISVGNKIFTNGGGLCYTTGYYQPVSNRYLRPIVTLKSSMLNDECDKDENGVWQINSKR